MLGAYWMNTGALILGLAAWGLGAAVFWQKQKRRPMYSAGSFAACSGSLCLELWYQAHLANIEDISAFLDTADAVALCAGVLLVVTLALNAAAWMICPQRENKMSG
ncbi:MAG: hypothetical protein HDT38_03765 [Clostridiales bacterium]|nr:hypothetical protein [Clostridiales bacterium]